MLSELRCLFTEDPEVSIEEPKGVADFLTKSYHGHKSLRLVCVIKWGSVMNNTVQITTVEEKSQ
jgi:hypothetical protein